MAGFETFRVPKEIFSLACSLAMLPLLPLVVTKPVLLRLREQRLPIALAAGAATWVTLCALLSHNSGREEAVITVWSTFVQFITFLIVAQNWTLNPLYWIGIPAAANTVVLTLERWAHWSPFRIVDIEGTHPATALLGNGNDAGMTLFLAATAFIALAMAESRRRRRRIAWAGAAFFTLGVVLSYTVTAIIALGVTVFTFAIMRLPSWRSRVTAAALMFAIAIILAGTVPGLRSRFGAAYETARAHRYNELLSNRLEPFLAAIEMFRQHPFLGIGPNGFATQYYDYKIYVDTKYRSLMPEDRAEWSRGRLINFQETHDEYLQILSELGIPGVLFLIAALIFVGSRSFGRQSLLRSNDCREFAVRLAFPLAAGFAVLCLAQFPFRIAAPRVFMTLLTAATCAWTVRDQET